jgi:hypothetical protein
MKAICVPSLWLASLMTAVVVSFSGCTVGGKSFSIDSNSRVPFFGLELQERKPKSTAPAFRSISWSGGGTPEVEVALQRTAITTIVLPTWGKKTVSLDTQEDLIARPAVPPRVESRRENAATQSTLIPLTISSDTGPDQKTNLRNVDFQ